jgi:hypothetical protein
MTGFPRKGGRNIMCATRQPRAERNEPPQAWLSREGGHRENALGKNTSSTDTDRIERCIHIEAPRSRVWRALSDAFRMNDGGWEAQLKNIDRHVARR